ncbi:MAG TPA: efflux transporter outer membrane subunit [Steroidobacteraceae bacterium]|nr:efflux transporter outer membrane subunit [Steroidobacteraceae bacterium]
MKHAIILLGAAALTACASLPGPAPAPAIKSQSAYASAQSFAAPAGEWPAAGWWKSYGDPQLDALIEEGLAGAPSLAIAEARLARARSFQDSARGALFPQISARASSSAEKQSYNYLSPAGMTPQGWNDYGRASLDFSWELDFWGKNRAALAAATSEAVAAEADGIQARLALSSAVASGYAELARLYSALDTAVAARDLRSKTADLFGKRYDNGLETLGSRRQADARRAASEADVLALEEQVQLQKNRLAALVGAGPDRALAIARPKAEFTRAFSLPATLSAGLIGRRPDLVAARLRAEAAAKRIHVQRAQFYPNVNLSAFVGVQAFGIDMLRESGSDIGAVGPAVTLPIFNGGRLRAQLRGAEAEYAESVANYDRALVQALQEVADAAVSQRALGAQLERIDVAVDAAREAWRVQNNRYEGGLATYLDVLSAEDYLLSNLRTQSDLRSRSMALDVALNRALGGGYQTNL